MARPSRTGGKASAAKTRKASSAKGRNPAKTKRRIAPTSIRSKRSAAPPGLGKELKEAREQQAATGEILKVIASSPDDVQPVFQAIADRSNRLVDALSTTVFSLVDGMLYLRAFTPTTPEADARLQATFPAQLSTFSWGESISKGEIYRVIDAEQESERLRDVARERGWRSALIVPLLRDGKPIGMIGPTRAEPGPFADHHVQLMQTFADQAVIAISNVGLFEQVQERTRDLEEALEQQTATADVLKVISRSAFDIHAVLRTLVESAARLCQAETVQIFLRDGKLYRSVADNGFSPEYRRYAEANPIAPGRGTCVARTALELATVHIPDVLLDPEYTWHEGRKLGGFRAMLGVPLLREQSCIGVMAMTRLTARPFTDRQIELVRVFADQAVIAIENVRLFDEVKARTEDLRESLQQQTATADVLKVISRSTFDLQTVLQTLVASAARLCDADKATITRKTGNEFYRAESFGFSDEFMDYVRTVPVKPDRGSATARALLEGVVVHIPDVTIDPDYTFTEGQKLGNFRTILAVPMLRETAPIGVIVLTRSEPRPFSDKQIELATTFADQAAIAIENVRLFDSVEARTRELAASLDELRAAQDRLVQTEKLASLGQLTAGIAHEIKNPLNFVNNFSALSVELTDELSDVLEQAELPEKIRQEVDELSQMLKSNLEKVVQHGKRVDSIVKNMLLHSREGSGERRSADINALVGESLNLAYHGARAEKVGFTITLQHDLDPEAGALDLYPQEMIRALLNLISNGFYAATRRKVEAGDGTFEPVISAVTRNLGKAVEIRIRDNGTGIPPEVKEKMFNPFFTTKPTGEGTGLGLSMTYDIIVKQHGGRIDVETRLGEFTEFIVTLPRDNRTASQEPE
jgi:two-component system, NtrC family, sensor kinase